MLCAIYTRKSSEEGLEQDFNSLQAQREACEAYIASQKHEGWIVLPTCYDDGGVSGATLERPALQRLLGDVKVGRIDTIVVYNAQPAKHPIILDIPIALTRAGTGMKLVVPSARNNAKCAPGLLRLLLRAFAIQDRLEQNPDLTLQRIAEAEGVSPSYATRALRLAYLAPDIVTAIIDGRQPPGLTANTLMKNTRLPFRWEAQRKRLGLKHA